MRIQRKKVGEDDRCGIVLAKVSEDFCSFRNAIIAGYRVVEASLRKIAHLCTSHTSSSECRSQGTRTACLWLTESSRIDIRVHNITSGETSLLIY